MKKVRLLFFAITLVLCSCGKEEMKAISLVQEETSSSKETIESSVEQDEKATGSTTAEESTIESKTEESKEEETKVFNQETKTTPSSTSESQTVHTVCTWDSGKVTTVATCNNEGTKTYTCMVCKKTKTESIIKTIHSYQTVKTAATCAVEGSVKEICSNCSHVKSETTLAKKDHNMVEIWFVEPTCNNSGSGHCYTCTECGHGVALANTPALGHNIDAGTVIITATCIQPGRLQHYCTRCHINMGTSDTPKDPNNHDWKADPEDGTQYCSCGAGK